ncbi:hypothetical protein, variant [Aphanomyces invadans]|uniref:Uncharacterized protein n=1 Tax=Aphanomyces invadans TaxID=157072 RepID=A0A024U9M0_9STRA|nr:hypothetical protein, variant [Aphanomyces invadans]ETW02587.1 hypothetical protein, variant [Aphanomyces invadans]|eukprot:XP_008869192.1 hypothetical protein, variant [Aphanomyces invadans]
MRATFLCLLWAAPALLSGVVVASEVGDTSASDHFIEDYFYSENSTLVTPSDAMTPGVFVGDAVILSIEEAPKYKEFVLHEGRTQDVIVFMSTSLDAKLVFERAVRRLDNEAPLPTRFFALPLPPPSATPPKPNEEVDFDDTIVSFKTLHNLPNIPEAGLHILVSYPATGSRSLAVHANNAKMVQVSTSEDGWVSRLQEHLVSSAAASEPTSSSSSSFPGILPIAVLLYVVVILIPSIAAHWQWWVALVQSKRLWFGLSLLGLYLSLSGSFYSLIHGAPLFHLSGQGTHLTTESC